MDAHVNADATEQWIHLTLRHGKKFDAQAIAARVPDCGYKLRRLELTAMGDVQDDVFVVTSNAQRFAFTSDEQIRGPGFVHGYFEPPIGPNPRLIIDTWTTELPGVTATTGGEETRR